jgi:hypothetical protein
LLIGDYFKEIKLKISFQGCESLFNARAHTTFLHMRRASLLPPPRPLVTRELLMGKSA